MTRKLQFLLTALLLMVGVTSAWADTDSKNWIGKLTATTNFYTESNSNLTVKSLDASNGTATLQVAAGKSEFRIGVTLPSDYEMNTSDAYFVLEATNLSTSSSKAKMDYLQIKVGDNTYKYECKTGNGCRFSKITLASSVLYVVSPMADNAASGISGTSGTMQELYEANSKVKAQQVRFIFDAASNGAEIVVKRMGFYTLSEILTMYPQNSNSKYIKWRQAYSKYPWVETDGEDASKANFRVNNKGDEELTVAKAKFFLSTLGNPACNMDMRNMYWGSYKEDVLAGFTNTPKILLTDGDQSKVPTMNYNVFVAGAMYYAYKDGSLAVSNKQDATTNTYYNYTRNFKEGYNSCVLPFDVTISELPTGLSAWVFGSATTGGEVTFTPASGTLSAGTPCIIKADEAGLYLIPAASTPNVISSPASYYATSASNNIKFVGSFVNEVPNGSCTNYGITTDGTKFAKMANTTKTNYYRAFISDQRSGSGTGYAPAYLNVNFGGITGISDIEIKQNVMENDNAPIYNLNGVRMNADNLPKGIYIKNGKKFVIK